MPLRVWLSARFFLFFLTWSSYLSYWGVWLLASGFRATQVTTVVTVGLVARSFSIAFLYPLLCRLTSLRRLSRALVWTAAGLSTLYLTDPGFGPMIAVSVLVGLAYPLLMPLSETLATIGAADGHVDYGSVRYFGSAGFIVGLGISGGIERQFGDTALVYVFVVGCSVMALADLVRPTTFPEGRTAVAGGGRRRLLRQPGYALALGNSVLLQGAHAAYYAFGAEYFRTLGVSSVQVSLMLALAVTCELLLFKYAGRLLGRRSVPVLFATAAGISLLRWGLLAAPVPVTVVVLTQTLHAGTFALTHIAHVRSVQEHVPKQLWATAHGLYAALAISLGVAAVTTVTGPLYAASPHWAFLCMAAVCLPCLPLAHVQARAFAGAGPANGTPGASRSAGEAGVSDAAIRP
ncbi:MFS transporter [Streptomyces sp. NPDC050263]|uniref:MFS transporter n=1 Tax=Streptomyces sp. NPDC050263 TaxID=3155037 RepID=UPI003413754E